MSKALFVLVVVIFVAGCGNSKYTGVPAGFSILPVENHDVPMKVSFDAYSEGEVREWRWSFSDGGTANIEDPSHVFEKEGDYSATLEITYPDGYKTEMTMVGIRAKNELRSYRSEDFEVKVLDKGSSFEFELFAHTNGWVGIAFPKVPGKLEGADFYLGYMKDGAPDVTDMYFHTRDETRFDSVMGGSDDAMPTGGREFFNQNKATTVTFEVPKNSTDRFDVPLKSGKYSVWIAMGPDNGKNFESKAVLSGWLEIGLP